MEGVRFKGPMFKTKEKHALEERKGVCRKLKRDHPTRIPIIVEHHKTGEVSRLLVPDHYCMGKLIHEARLHLCKDPFAATWLMTGGDNVVPRVGQDLATVYERHADEDGFLYLWMTEDNAFGSR